MKLRIWTLIITVLLNLVLALSPYLPYTKEVWRQNDPQVFYAMLATMVGIDFVLLTAAVGIILLQEGAQLASLQNEIRQRMSEVIVRRMRGSEFYLEFSNACKVARFSVAICYFSALPPDRGGRDYQIEYYKDQLKTIKNARNVTFKRMVRESAQNREWIKKLMSDLKGKHNANLAVLTDVDASVEMPLAMSVQIIDDRQVWFVALKSHQPEGEFRDLYVESRDVAAAMTEYYERLWAMSKVILKMGEVTMEGKAFLESAG